MTGSSRIVVLLVTAALLVVAFVVLAPKDDEPAGGASGTVTSTAPAQTTTTQAAPPPAPAPRYDTVRVRAGKPVGGVKRIEIEKGERARIQVTSSDTEDEVHLHGYDLSKQLPAGGRVRFAFEADAEGIFELELERAGVQIAELVVEPG